MRLKSLIILMPNNSTRLETIHNAQETRLHSTSLGTCTCCTPKTISVELLKLLTQAKRRALKTFNSERPFLARTFRDTL